MTLTIDLPDEQTAALAAKARAHGMSAEEYARQVLAHDLDSSSEPRPIWEVILDNMKDVPRESSGVCPKMEPAKWITTSMAILSGIHESLRTRFSGLR